MSIVQAVAITTIETQESGVGICLASLYSPRAGFENWVQGNLHAGFTDIYVRSFSSYIPTIF